MLKAEMPETVAFNYASAAYDTRKFIPDFQNDATAKILAQFSIPKEPNTMTRRLVQVFIADPNENIPLDDCLLYKGDQKLTDLTDQELFFEIDIKSILATHNEKRAKLVDKKIKERTEYLEPARVRDLKMVVATLATF